MGDTYRVVKLARIPRGMPEEADFDVVEQPVPRPAEGQVLVRNIWMSLDPSMRLRMTPSMSGSYRSGFAVGETLNGFAVGRVVESRSRRFRVGDCVLDQGAWQEMFLGDEGDGGWRDIRRVEPGEVSERHFLGALGASGFTAWVGLREAAGIRDGDTVWVSAAAGGVGGMVIQLARAWGHRVIGSAGSPEKVDHLVRTLGADGAFDYHDGHVLDRIRELAPDGIDVYFDNVGGDHLEAALESLRLGGRVALCGAVSTYQGDVMDAVGPRNLMQAVFKRLSLRGFLASHYADRFTDFSAEVGDLLRQDRLVLEDTLYDGIETAPQAFIDMFGGRTSGKVMVRL